MEHISNAVEQFKDLILEAERYIWKNPETGYREVKTTKYLAEKFCELGYDIVLADGITGFYTVIDTGREGPEVLILGELDSIICPTHPESDKDTGAVHSCGHNAQCAALLGVAAALTSPEVLEKLCGKIRLCAVPAEELLEIEYRNDLIKQGKIKYMGGKSEFLSRGYFDGVDIAFMVHSSANFNVNGGSNGIVAKNIIYKGVASHAGGAPQSGINALYAATCGINAVNAIRETFVERDQIRFHPIITHGGDMVNAIPEEVRIETYVRGSSIEGITKVNKKVNRALIGAAYSIGANIEIIDIPGYAPLVNDKNMVELAKDAAAIAMPERPFTVYHDMIPSSTDMGDLSTIMPVVHPYCPGAKGKGHGNDYYIVDPYLACVQNAKWQVTMLTLLLENGAERAKKVISEFKPYFKSKEEFLAHLDSVNTCGDRIVYKDDGSAEIKLY